MNINFKINNQTFILILIIIVLLSLLISCHNSTIVEGYGNQCETNDPAKVTPVHLGIPWYDDETHEQNVDRQKEFCKLKKMCFNSEWGGPWCYEPYSASSQTQLPDQYQKEYQKEYQQQDQDYLNKRFEEPTNNSRPS